jgi:hypothetical protein
VLAELLLQISFSLIGGMQLLLESRDVGQQIHFSVALMPGSGFDRRTSIDPRMGTGCRPVVPG